MEIIEFEKNAKGMELMAVFLDNLRNLGRQFSVTHTDFAYLVKLY